MTKSDYQKLRVGSKVKVNTNDIDRTGSEPKIVPVTLIGTVVTFSAGMGRQVLIKFDNGEGERWYGRFGIENT